MKAMLKIRPSRLAYLHDVTAAALSFALSMYLRLGNDLFAQYPLFFQGVALFTAISAVTISLTRTYRGIWRYFSSRDLLQIGKAAIITIFAFSAIMFLATRLEGMPRSVPFINLFLFTALLGGPRFIYRSMKDKSFKLDFRISLDKRIPVLLIGAGDNAELFLRETNRNQDSSYRVVGFVDAHPHKAGRSIHGVRVYGNYGALPEIVAKLERKGRKPQKLIIAEEISDGGLLRQFLETTDSLGLTIACLPRLSDLKPTDNMEQIRPVAIEDLLGRPQKALNRESMRTLIEGKRVLITGAGGSIGSELAAQIAACRPAHLTLLDFSEFGLYQVTQLLSEKFPQVAKSSVIANVREKENIESLFHSITPELVFHAAAIKHVPLAEENPEETVLTNVFGTINVADAAISAGVALMVMVSTDKAVNPGNVMGATKRIAEHYIQGLAQNTTKFVTVRFGNVLGSTGSVVPLFQRQLQEGGPLTVTHPDITRYFMTIREAVELVLQAAAIGLNRRGKPEIFVLDMGEPIKITELARQIIKLAGMKPEVDVKITYTGLRPGEKLYEELFYDFENPQVTDIPGVLLARHRGLNPEVFFSAIANLERAVLERDRESMLAEIRNITGEYDLEKSGQLVR